MNRKHFYLVFLITLPLLLGGCTHMQVSGQSSPQEENTEKITEKLCQEHWNELWPKAKAGDLEARFALFVSIAPVPDAVPIVPPGSSNDWISMLRNIVIFGAYAMDYINSVLPEDKYYSFVQSYGEEMPSFFRLAGFDQNEGGEKFLKCITAHKTHCADEAAKDHLLPSFKEFAQQIDARIAAGERASCIF